MNSDNVVRTEQGYSAEIDLQPLENRLIDLAESETHRLVAPVAVLLCCAWLVLPAVQYYATYQRTGLQIEGNAGAPQLASLDLTVFYLALLGVSVAFCVVRYAVWRNREARNSTSPSSSATLEATDPQTGKQEAGL